MSSFAQANPSRQGSFRSGRSGGGVEQQKEHFLQQLQTPPSLSAVEILQSVRRKSDVGTSASGATTLLDSILKHDGDEERLIAEDGAIELQQYPTRSGSRRHSVVSRLQPCNGPLGGEHSIQPFQESFKFWQFPFPFSLGFENGKCSL